MAAERFKLVQSKREAEIKNDKKAIGDNLRKKEYDIARIKVEAVLSKQRLVAALVTLGLMVSLVFERLDLICSERKCPQDLEQTILTVVWASTRVPIPEMKVIGQQLVHKYGAEFFAADRAREARGESRVNTNVRADLTAAVPSDEIKNETLIKIAQENNIEFKLEDLFGSSVNLFPPVILPKDDNDHKHDGNDGNGGGGGNNTTACAANCNAKCTNCPTVCPTCNHTTGGGNNGNNIEPTYAPPMAMVFPNQMMMPGMMPPQAQIPVSFIDPATGKVIPNNFQQQPITALPVGLDAVNQKKLGEYAFPPATIVPANVEPANVGPAAMPAGKSETVEEYQAKKLGYIPGTNVNIHVNVEKAAYSAIPANVHPSYSAAQGVQPPPLPNGEVPNQVDFVKPGKDFSSAPVATPIPEENPSSESDNNTDSNNADSNNDTTAETTTDTTSNSNIADLIARAKSLKN